MSRHRRRVFCSKKYEYSAAEWQGCSSKGLVFYYVVSVWAEMEKLSAIRRDSRPAGWGDNRPNAAGRFREKADLGIYLGRLPLGYRTRAFPARASGIRWPP
jgi:hypothetical protein